MSVVVVDTSSWIEFFAGRPQPAVEEALRLGAVLLRPIVGAELLSGARTSRDRKSLLALLERLPLHPTPLAHWAAVGDLRATLARRGLSVSTPGAHVAQCALDVDGLLASSDAVFARVARIVPLRLAES